MVRPKSTSHASSSGRVIQSTSAPRFHTSYGAKVLGLVPNFRPEDGSERVRCAEGGGSNAAAEAMFCRTLDGDWDTDVQTEWFCDVCFLPVGDLATGSFT